MAEFKEVIRKKEKMCDFYAYDHCNECPLNWKCSATDMAKYTDEIEEIIMNWQKPIDWSQVAIDTKILVRNGENDLWKKRYFANYEKGLVYAYSDGKTSWSTDFVTSWKYAKLWEGEDDAKND